MAEQASEGTRGRVGFYPGWIMVGVCLFGISTGPAAFGVGSIGVFMGPLQREFGWSVSQISTAVTVMMLCTTVCMSIAGKLVDHFGAKAVLAPSVAIFGLCIAGIPLIATQYWIFIALFVGMGTIAIGSNSIGYVRLLGAWFDKSRGLAIGIAGSGTGLGFAYVPVFCQYLVDQYGWRAGYYGLAAIMLLATLPLVLFVLRDRPGDVGLNVDGGAIEAKSTAETGIDVRAALRTAPFWLILCMFASLAFVLYGLISHLVPMLTHRGVAAGLAAAIASLFGLASFGGRVLIGALVDRFDARRVAAFFFLLSAVGVGLLAADLPLWAFYAAAILLGGTLGAEVDLLAFLISRYFGMKYFAGIFGVMFGVVMFGMALGPLAFGAVYDATGSYYSILALGAPICLVSTVLMLLMRPYPRGDVPRPVRR